MDNGGIPENDFWIKQENENELYRRINVYRVRAEKAEIELAEAREREAAANKAIVEHVETIVALRAELARVMGIVERAIQRLEVAEIVADFKSSLAALLRSARACEKPHMTIEEFTEYMRAARQPEQENGDEL